MTTTLTPPPNEAEKKFLMDAFIMFKEDGMRLSSVGHTNDDCFAKAEDLLQSFRSRYGAPPEAKEPTTTQDFQAAHIEALQTENARLRGALEDLNKALDAMWNDRTCQKPSEKHMKEITKAQIRSAAILKGGSNESR